MRLALRSRSARLAAGALGLAVAAAVLVHLPPVRRLLAAHGQDHGGSCPFGYGGAATAAPQIRRAHELRGDLAARARPALGFALDATTPAELTRWAQAHALDCAARHGGTLIECAHVPAALLTGSGSLALTSAWFEFGHTGTLASIRTVRRDPDAGAVATAFAEIQRDLTARAGAPAHTDGSAAPAALARSALNQAMVEYRFTDYRSVVRATNMGDGFVLTEEYAALTD